MAGDDDGVDTQADEIASALPEDDLHAVAAPISVY